MGDESFEDFGSGGSNAPSPFGPSAFRRSTRRQSQRFRRVRPVEKAPPNGNSQRDAHLSPNEGVESDIDDLSDQMSTMQQRILKIEEERQAKQEHTEQIKIENTELKMRLNELETNYHDLQLKFDEMRTKERSKAKEDIEKLSKEKGLELEVQKQQLSTATDELSRLKKDNEKLRSKTDRYKKQLESLSDKIEMAQDKVVEQIEKYQKLNEKTAAEREALLAQLAELNEAKAEYQTHISTLETQAKEVRVKYQELDQQMRAQANEAVKLITKQEKADNSEIGELRNQNEKLTQQVEDLNLQFLQQHIAKAKDFQKQDSDSFASEVGLMEIDELALKYAELKCQHKGLQDYLDSLLTTILERDPSILEQCKE